MRRPVRSCAYTPVELHPRTIAGLLTRAGLLNGCFVKTGFSKIYALRRYLSLTQRNRIKQTFAC